MSYENSKHSGAAAKQTVPQDAADGMKSSERKSTIPMRTAALPLTSVSGPSKAPNKQPRATVAVVLVWVTVEVMVVVDDTDVVDTVVVVLDRVRVIEVSVAVVVDVPVAVLVVVVVSQSLDTI